MEAGYKLDALVAKKVLGLDVDWRCCEDGHWTTLPSSYSTDIAAAWPIAEKLGLALVPQSAEGGFHWLAMDLEKVVYDGTVVLLKCGDAYYSAPTAPLAICLAALVAMGVDIDNEEAEHANTI